MKPIANFVICMLCLFAAFAVADPSGGGTGGGPTQPTCQGGANNGGMAVGECTNDSCAYLFPQHYTKTCTMWCCPDGSVQWTDCGTPLADTCCWNKKLKNWTPENFTACPATSTTTTTDPEP